MSKENRKIMKSCIFIGVLIIAIVFLKAYAAQIQRENNVLISENTKIKEAITAYNSKIKEANSIKNIEEVARTKLGMVYPKEGEYVYLSKEAKPKENLAYLIKSKAYN